MNEPTDMAQKAEQDKRAADARREMWAWVRWLVCTVLLVVGIRMFVFEPVRVDGPSMEDTLFTNEVMAVSKAHYRLSAPRRGDVVVCHFRSISSDNYVKRVIGLPGEVVEIHGSVVYIDGVAIDEPYLTKPKTADMAPVVVPADSFLVMGDNRGNSADSRKDFIGCIPRSELVGKAMVVMWPLDRLSVIKH